MSKIDIAIKSTFLGSQEPIALSHEPWHSSIRDVRDVFSQLEGFEDKYVTMLSFCQTGALLTVIKHIAGRNTDNSAAWLYVPSTCGVTGNELVALLRDVKALLAGSSISPDALRALVAREYPDRPFVSYRPSPKEGDYAFRGTDFYPLHMILGEDRYQEYYTHYKYVFLIERTDTVVPKEGVKDFTRTELVRFVTVVPPSDEELRRVLGPDGRLLCQGTSQSVPFNGPIQFRKGQTVNLSAYREGFEPIPFSMDLTDSVQEFHFPAGFAPVWRKRLTSKSFRVLDSETRKPVQARILVDGSELPPEGLSLTDEEARNVSLQVKAAGYESFERKGLISAREICLDRKLEEYKFYVRTEGESEPSELIIRTKKGLRSDFVPLKGYVRGHHDRSMLYYDDKLPRRSFLFGVLAGVVTLGVCALLAWGVVSLVNRFKSGNDRQETGTEYVDRNRETKPERVPRDAEDSGSEQTESSATGFESASRYMEGHMIWTKSEMEGINGLQGLFDAMNRYDFGQIVSILGPLGVENGRVRRLYEAALKCLDLRVSQNGRFLGDGDEQITVENYINVLERKSGASSVSGSPGPNQAGQGSAPRPEKGASTSSDDQARKNVDV